MPYGNFIHGIDIFDSTNFGNYTALINMIIGKTDYMRFYWFEEHFCITLRPMFKQRNVRKIYN